MTLIKTAPHRYSRYPDYVQFAIVDDPEKKAGWDILELFTGDIIETLSSEAIGVAPASASAGYIQSAQVMYGNRSVVVRRTQFLMGRLETDVVAEYAAFKTSAGDTQAALRGELRSTQARATTIEENLKYREEDLKTVNELLKESQAKSADLAEQLRRIRTVLGEKAVNEAMLASSKIVISD